MEWHRLSDAEGLGRPLQPWCARDELSRLDLCELFSDRRGGEGRRLLSVSTAERLESRNLRVACAGERWLHASGYEQSIHDNSIAGPDTPKRQAFIAISESWCQRFNPILAHHSVA